MHQQKWKLNIPQITHAKLAQSGRHHSGSKEVPGLIPNGDNLFYKIYFALHKPLLPMSVPTLYNWENIFEKSKLYTNIWDVNYDFPLSPSFTMQF